MARVQRAPPKPECYCCLELGADLVTYCCFQGLCQLCAKELAGSPEDSHPKHCFCGQQYRGSQFLRTKPTPDSALAAKAADDVKEAQQHLDQERAKMEDWFVVASATTAAAGTWHLDVPLLDYYRAEVKAIALVQERLDRVGPKGPWASSGYYIKDLEDFTNIFGFANTLRYRFKPPGHIMYHPHIVYLEGVRGEPTTRLPGVRGLPPQPLSIQPHSFEEIMDRYANYFYDNHLPSDNWNLTMSIIEKFGDPDDGGGYAGNWDFELLRANPAIDQTLINEYYGLTDTPDMMKIYTSHYWYTTFYSLTESELGLVGLGVSPEGAPAEEIIAVPKAPAAKSDQEIYEFHQTVLSPKDLLFSNSDLVEILSHPARTLDVKFIDKHPELDWDFIKLFANPNIKWQW